jgi:superfamily II DNA or RNA helicase
MSATRFICDVYQTGATITVVNEYDRYILQKYEKGMSQFEEKWVPGRGRVRSVRRTFIVSNKTNGTFGIHRNQIQDFIDFLKDYRVSDEEILIKLHDSHVGGDNNLEMIDGFKLRDNQVPIIDFLCQNRSVSILPIQMGTGKTCLALHYVCKIKKRAMVVMGAMHIDTWIRDAKKFYKDTNKVKVIRGNAQLRKYIHEGMNDKLDADIFLVSVNTIRDYLTEFEEHGKSTYGCEPKDLYRILGIHVRVTDEVHENLHFNFRHAIQTDTPISVYLSATIISYDPFINKLYNIIYPLDRRYTGLVWKKYVNVYAVGYELEEPRKVKYKGGNGMYSHHVYEDWITKDPGRLNRYLKLVSGIANEGFIKVYQSGMKLLIIFSSVEMCQIAASYFTKTYPQFTVTSYNADDENETLHNFDIICSTLGSSGTGVNIVGLRTLILTIGLQNREKNIQVMGRLRELEELYPGVNPSYYYMVVKDIPKQMVYHYNKLKLFSSLVKSHKTLNVVSKV